MGVRLLQISDDEVSMLRGMMIVLGLLLAMTALPAHALMLVDAGKPAAVVVIADTPSPVAQYAVQELVTHIQKATGATLPIVSESQAGDASTPRIYIGQTRAAAERKIVPADLGNDGFVLRVVDGHLFVLGNADGDDPLQRSEGSHRGTLFGVYDILERYVNVRWLWPGELGTHMPPAQTLTIPDTLDEKREPAFRFRRFRGHPIREAAANYKPELRRLAFTDQGLQNYARDLQIYKAHYRLGDTEKKPMVGHYFSTWWDKYGKDHPEWFMMRADGKRGPAPGQSSKHVAMCVSNPELHKFIVEKAWDGGDVLLLGEVDRRVFCQCENCLKWDEPQPASHPAFVRNLYRPQMASNRYARFWKTIYDMAVKRNPNVMVTTFLYWNYIPAPTTGVQFNNALYGEFVPWGQDEVTYFPMSPQACQWLEQQWQGWQQSGVKLAYRPNYFHGGYVMPHLSTRQAASFFKFAAKHGMIGFDQDMLIGHWAVKGPMFYLHMRLAVDPELHIEQLRREYFAAFGPAAGVVEKYFDYWEDYALKRPGSNLHNHVDAHIAYPQEVFAPAAKMLEQAAKLTADHERAEYAQRVAFLQAGLEHARLASKFCASLDLGRVPKEADRFRAAQAALKELVAFRRAHEHLYIADFIAASRQENRRIDIDALLADVKDADLQTQENAAVLGAWEFRKDPQNQGTDQKWYVKASQPRDGWATITVPAFWAHTHVGRYLGHGWYRTTFTISPKYRNEPLNILFESVDEQAWVYLNGRLVGEHTVKSQGLPVSELWNRPFTIQLPAEYLNAQGENELVVHVHSAENNAGIWGPVRIYAPRDLD